MSLAKRAKLRGGGHVQKQCWKNKQTARQRPENCAVCALQHISEL